MFWRKKGQEEKKDKAIKSKEQWLSEGSTLVQSDRYQEALVAFDRVVQFDPNYVSGTY